MAIKTTSIKDVFKQQIKESVKQPTIWVDYYGTTHEDTKYEWIEAYEKKLAWETIPSEGKNPFKIYHEMGVVDNRFTQIPVGLGIYGTIIQVGSHVKKCGRLFDPYVDKFKPIQFDSSKLTDVFRYATSLEETKELFYMAHFSDSNPKLPEDLFWNCPNLKSLKYAFVATDITEIPENLFARNPKLEDISGCFSLCSNITSIPENLFKNNPNLKDIAQTFERTGIKEIPYKLLEPLRDKIENGKIGMLGCFSDAAITDRYKDICNDLGLDLYKNPCRVEPFKQLKEEGLVPDYLSDEKLSSLVTIHRPLR